ncbi:hypothetical protein U9M48_030067 [Paspalum notatum var. saurae]|uniref:Ozone-responsive stress-related protein n=1 Tax=Paspalum notatum var. saurae TaxID=547442 RepID=A0AAQ3X3D2_PASNO
MEVWSSRCWENRKLLPSQGNDMPLKLLAIVCVCDDNMTSKMTAGYIVGSLVGSFAIAYLCDTFISDKKAFGGTTPNTVSDKEWWKATDTKFQAWPRTAGPPVIMNPISRQNFIVKSTE